MTGATAIDMPRELIVEPLARGCAAEHGHSPEQQLTALHSLPRQQQWYSPATTMMTWGVRLGLGSVAPASGVRPAERPIDERGAGPASHACERGRCAGFERQPGSTPRLKGVYIAVEHDCASVSHQEVAPGPRADARMLALAGQHPRGGGV